ncbi:MAG: putative collagen-binding domain-containing protein [Flavobacteriaceae bacterium]
MKNGEESQLDLGNSTDNFNGYWYNPRKGGTVEGSKTTTIKGPGKVNLGLAPVKKEREKDWVVWITKG